MNKLYNILIYTAAAAVDTMFPIIAPYYVLYCRYTRIPLEDTPSSVSISPDGKAVAVLLPGNNSVEIYRLGKKPGDEASCVLTISNVSSYT